MIIHIGDAIGIGVIVGPLYLYKSGKELSTLKATKELLSLQQS